MSEKIRVLAWSEQSEPRQVLNMGGDKKRSGIQHKHAKANVFALAIELLGDVTAKHTGTNDNDVKRSATVAADLPPSATCPTAENVVRELGLLDIRENVRIGIEARQHGMLLWFPPKPKDTLLQLLRL